MSKRVTLIGILAPVLLLTGCAAPEAEQANKQETEWQIEEDKEPAAGSNLFYGSSMVAGKNSLFAADLGRYGGKPAEEDERCYIYQREAGEWEADVPESGYYSNDHKLEISHLLYWDGYVYYTLRAKNAPEKGSMIHRFSEELEYDSYGGHRTYESLNVWFDKDLYLYQGYIYFKCHDNRKRYFFKMSMDGEEAEELYSDEQEDAYKSDFAVGGGCLYLKDGEQVLGIHLKTGERKEFETDAEHIDGLYYECGCLYIYDDVNGQVYQMNVRTGSESKLTEGRVLLDCAWVQDGCLYYAEGRKEQEAFYCDLKAVNPATKEVSLWESVPFDRQPCEARLEVSEGCVAAYFCVRKENETREYTYLEKEIGEITDAAYKGSVETQGKEKKEGEIRTIIIQDGSQEGGQQIAVEDDRTAMGNNLSWDAGSAEGNGCIYSTNWEICDGEPPKEKGENNYANIYRLKEGKWELFASHPATEEDDWDTEISVYNMAYYNGYLYYILLRDLEPQMGSSGKYYSICRVSEQGKAVEKLAECNGSFFIYQGHIYYADWKNHIKQYFRMKPDGSDKELIYFDNDNREDYWKFCFTVGGECLYLQDGKQILEIDLENDIRRVFRINLDKTVQRMVYEAGKLYAVCNDRKIMWQLDVKTGEEKMLTERNVDARIHEGYMYYAEQEEKDGEILYLFKAMNLETGESAQWHSISSKTRVSCEIVALDDQVIIRYAFKEGEEKGPEVYGDEQYFRKEISEIAEEIRGL